MIFRPFESRDVDAVRQFNARLAEKGKRNRLPENPFPSWLPKGNHPDLYQEHFLADDNGTVRGGYTLKTQEFLLSGNLRTVKYFYNPLSEGIIDHRYSSLGVTMLWQVLREHKSLFSLGIGGYDEPYAKLLKGLKWFIKTVPFFFYIVNPNAFLGNISFLRRTLGRRCALDVLRFSGIGWLAIKCLNLFNRLFHAGIFPPVTCREVSGFDESVDRLWNGFSFNDYSFIAIRDRLSVSTLYPAEKSGFIRLSFTSGDKPVGWAVLLNTKKQNDSYFGNLTLGSIVDYLAAPGYESAVIAGCVGVLRKKGADLVVSNQLHAAWQRAFQSAGFLKGPSNFLFACSPGLIDEIVKNGGAPENIFVTRGDGDGPIHL